jgi:hypothetical protein
MRSAASHSKRVVVRIHPDLNDLLEPRTVVRIVGSHKADEDIRSTQANEVHPPNSTMTAIQAK